MRINRVFIEREAESRPTARDLLARLKTPNITVIDKIEDIFGRVKKPYLQRVHGFNLFIGIKKGELVKPAPPAYGLSNAPHYYFVHAYNCIFECEYCYLQGYFSSPDLVLFVNHEEICAEIKRFTREVHRDGEVWFHAGEFSDSLALSHLTQDWPFYWQTFSELAIARLELRSKSANIKSLLSLPPLPNVFPSFSLAPESQVSTFEHKTASLVARLKAMLRLANHGFRLGVHFDPIIYQPNILLEYKELITSLLNEISPEAIEYVSLGTVRFSKKVFAEVLRNYPQSSMLNTTFVTNPTGKVSYIRPRRQWLLNNLKDKLILAGIEDKKIYFCMEDSLSCGTNSRQNGSIRVLPPEAPGDRRSLLETSEIH